MGFGLMYRPEIQIISVGPVDDDVLDYLSLVVSGTFDVPCNAIQLQVDPTAAYDSTRRQYSSAQLLAKLLALNACEDCRILGVTGVDLFIPVLTFVFGQAQVDGRVALISTHRLHPEFYGLPPDKNLFYSRCEKEANHELGHTLGLVHCRSYDCVMHASNSVEQVDLKPSGFCVSCRNVTREAICSIGEIAKPEGKKGAELFQL